MSEDNLPSEYEPEVDDYVIWEQKTWCGKSTDKGWVYFKAPKFEDKKGFNTPARYITIETAVFDKPDNPLPPSSGIETKNPHKKIHSLLLCYEHNWHELKFVKRRKSSNIFHYSQYDDVNVE